MAKYSKEYKLAIARKLAVSPLTDRQFANQEGLACATLHAWKVKYPVDRKLDEKSLNPERWSSAEKFSVVLEIASLSEVEFNEYCRAKGLYPEQVRLWKEACIQGNMANNEKKRQVASQSAVDKKRIKELERELRRKDKALAETAALLVLRKKLHALWEPSEDE